MKVQGNGNFDRVAPIYDTLAYIVFGSSIRKAQHAFLDSISSGDTVLVLGGGTGKFLPALRNRIVEGHIVFIDTSAEMISRARERVADDGHVTFLHGRLEDLAAEFKADVIITHFFLDLFGEHEIGEVIQKITKHTLPHSKWIVSDFFEGQWLWQRILLKSMYLFFRISTKLPNRILPDWHSQLIKNGYSEVERQEFYKRFIRASVFEKDSKRFESTI